MGCFVVLNMYEMSLEAEASAKIVKIFELRNSRRDVESAGIAEFGKDFVGYVDARRCENDVG